MNNWINDCYLSIKDNVLDVLNKYTRCHVINVLSLSPVLYTNSEQFKQINLTGAVETLGVCTNFKVAHARAIRGKMDGQRTPLPAPVQFACSYTRENMENTRLRAAAPLLVFNPTPDWIWLTLADYKPPREGTTTTPCVRRGRLNKLFKK